MRSVSKRSTATRVVVNKKILSHFLKINNTWKLNSAETELTRTVSIHNYIEGLTLIARFSVHAELLQHHPDIHLSYRKLTIKVSTHAIKAITAIDIELATRIEHILIAQAV